MSKQPLLASLVSLELELELVHVLSRPSHSLLLYSLYCVLVTPFTNLYPYVPTY